MYKYVLSFLVFFSLISQESKLECSKNEISGTHLYLTDRDCYKSCILCGIYTSVFLPADDGSDDINFTRFREHERESQETGSPKYKKNDFDGRFYCNWGNCGKSYSELRSLRYHVDAAHLQKQLYRCKFCDEKFVFRHKRDWHISQYHTN